MCGTTSFSSDCVRRRVPEEVRDADEQILHEGRRFVSVMLQEVRVFQQAAHARQAQPTFDAPEDRRRLVVGEVMARAHSQEREDLPERFRVGRSGCAARCVPGQLAQAVVVLRAPFRRNVSHGKHVVDQTRGDRIPRHVPVFRLIRILGDGEAAMFLHTLQSARPVRSSTRQHDRDGFPAVRISQRAKKQVHRGAPLFRPADCLGHDRAAGNLETCVRGDHVDVVGLNGDRALDLRDRQRRCRLQDLGQPAFVVGRQMKNDGIRRAALCRYVGKELPQRRNAACGCANPHHQHLIRRAVVAAGNRRTEASAIIPH